MCDVKDLIFLIWTQLVKGRPHKPHIGRFTPCKGYFLIYRIWQLYERYILQGPQYIKNIEPLPLPGDKPQLGLHQCHGHPSR